MGMKRKQTETIGIMFDIAKLIIVLSFVALIVIGIQAKETIKDNPLRLSACQKVGLQYFNGTDYCVLIKNNASDVQYHLDYINGNWYVNEMATITVSEK
jgi:hypothetical protein